MRKLISFLLSLFAFLLFPAAVFAGGGPVALYTFPLRPFDQTKTFILEAEIYTRESCDQLKPVFSFSDSFAGDSIAPFTPPADGTYITSHWYTGAPDYVFTELCDIYAQAKSGAAKQRTAMVKVVVNGKEETRGVPVSFGNDEISRQIQSFGRVNNYDNEPHVDVINQTYLGNGRRDVELHWQKIAWAAKYSVFGAELADDWSTHPGLVLLTQAGDGLQTHIKISSTANFHLGVLACRADDPCTEWKDNVQGPYLLSKMQNNGQSSLEPPTSVEIMPNIVPPDSVPNEATLINVAPPQESTSQAQIDELNKKVASLEAQLAKSAQKQNILEQKLAGLLAFLRRIFPFFR